jgi:hypothetical protein
VQCFNSTFSVILGNLNLKSRQNSAIQTQRSGQAVKKPDTHSCNQPLRRRASGSESGHARRSTGMTD